MNSKPKWEQFEINSCDYLNGLYNGSLVSFHRTGGSNSMSNDIQVCKGDQYLFSIEAKYSPSQSGQFVIAERDGLYTLSDKGKSGVNVYTQPIINHLNNNKDEYSPKGQKAKEIKVDKLLLANWIIEHYKMKKNHFIVTSNKLYDYKAILPINEIINNFDISAVVRRKKSGTGYVPKKELQSCIGILNKHTSRFDLTICEVITQGEKTLIVFDNVINLKKLDRYFGTNYYLSSNRDGNGYYIKKRSNTNNLNVVFSLVYTGTEVNQGGELLERFVSSFLSP